MSYKSPYELANTADLAPARSTIFFEIEVRRIADDFKGAFAGEFIPQGATIARDGGVIVSAIDDVLSDKNYVALIDDGLWLAPRDYDDLEPIFFLNHSCESNVARLGGLIYIAKRDIQAGEQLTIDYAPLISGFGDWKMACLCGTANCRGVITSHDSDDTQIAEQLWNEWLPFVQRKIMASRLRASRKQHEYDLAQSTR